MKTEEITIANLKCNGCASTIKKEILKLEGVQALKLNWKRIIFKLALKIVPSEVVL